MDVIFVIKVLWAFLRKLTNRPQVWPLTLSTNLCDNLWILRQFHHIENHLSFVLFRVFFFGENFNSGGGNKGIGLVYVLKIS